MLSKIYFLIRNKLYKLQAKAEVEVSQQNEQKTDLLFPLNQEAPTGFPLNPERDDDCNKDHMEIINSLIKRIKDLEEKVAKKEIRQSANKNMKFWLENQINRIY